MVLVVPWMMLTIYCNGEHLKLNVIAETIGTCSFLIWHMGREFYMFRSWGFESMLMYYILGKPHHYRKGAGDVMQVLMEGKLSVLFSLCRYAFYTCMIILVVINFPRANKARYVKQQEVGMRGLHVFREVCVVGILLLPVVVYVIQVVFAQQIMDASFGSDTIMQIVQQLRE